MAFDSSYKQWHDEWNELDEFYVFVNKRKTPNEC